MYIVLEGPDGSGKSTTAKALKLALELQGMEVAMVREPGGSPSAEKIRDIVFDYDFTKSTEDLKTVIGLMYASRMQLMIDIEDRLSNGIVVISDRNYFTSLTYQVLPIMMDNLMNSELSEDIYKLVTGFQSSVIEPDHVFMLSSIKHNREDGNAYDAIARKIDGDMMYHMLEDMLTLNPFTAICVGNKYDVVVEALVRYIKQMNEGKAKPASFTPYALGKYTKWFDLFTEVLCSTPETYSFKPYKLGPVSTVDRVKYILGEVTRTSSTPRPQLIGTED